MLPDIILLLLIFPPLLDAIQCLNTSDDLYFFPVECPAQTRYCLNVARIERRVTDSALQGVLIESKECDEHRICEHMRLSPLYNHKINADEHYNETGCVVTPHLRVCCCSTDFCNGATSTSPLLLLTLVLLLYQLVQ